MSDNDFNNSLLIPVLFRKITVIIKAEADKDSREYLLSCPLSPRTALHLCMFHYTKLKKGNIVVFSSSGQAKMTIRTVKSSI